MLFSGLKFWAIAIAAAALIAIITLYVMSAEKAKGKVLALEAKVADLTVHVETKTAKIADLNDRIRANNQAKLDELAQAEAARQAAKAAADKAVAERAAMATQLAEARRKYQEMVNSDPNLRVYQSTAVPVAVLDRLRSANGEADH